MLVQQQCFPFQKKLAVDSEVDLKKSIPIRQTILNMTDSDAPNTSDASAEKAYVDGEWKPELLFLFQSLHAENRVALLDELMA